MYVHVNIRINDVFERILVYRPSYYEKVQELPLVLHSNKSLLIEYYIHVYLFLKQGQVLKVMFL